MAGKGRGRANDEPAEPPATEVAIRNLPRRFPADDGMHSITIREALGWSSTAPSGAPSLRVLCASACPERSRRGGIPPRRHRKLSGDVHRFASCSADTPVRVPVLPASSKSAKSQEGEDRGIPPFESAIGGAPGCCESSVARQPTSELKIIRSCVSNSLLPGCVSQDRHGGADLQNAGRHAAGRRGDVP
jgi:hypothetical protein